MLTQIQTLYHRIRLYLMARRLSKKIGVPASALMDVAYRMADDIIAEQARARKYIELSNDQYTVH